MRTIAYQTILEGSADLCGLDRGNIGSADFAVLRQAHGKALQTAWEQDHWPELLRVEKRYYRDLYDAATAYAAPSASSAVEVYYPSTGKYYQTLKATTGNAPADALGVVDSTRWAESSGSYSPSKFAAATAYLVGDKVFYPTTDRSYALHTAAAPGTLPTDTAKWGILTDFDAYVAYEQTGRTALGNVLMLTDANPRVTTATSELGSFLSERGVQVITPSTSAWLTYRLRTLDLRGAVFSATATYSSGTQVYYSSATSPGDFYTANTTTTSGQDPEDTPASWDIQSIPLIFQRYLELAGAADYHRYAGMTEKAEFFSANATEHLGNQAQLLCGQQLNAKRTIVLTR